MSKRRWSARACATLGLLGVCACDPLVSTVLVEFGETTTVPLALPFTPVSLEPGDFDGDGAVDLLLSGSPGMGAAGVVLRGNGDGTLQAGIDAEYQGCSAYPVVGDLDGDERSDLVTLGCGNTVAPFVGQADATLAPWSAWPANSYPYQPITGLALGDFEGDGDGDVFLLRMETMPAWLAVAYVHIELSNGAQGFWSTGTSTFNPAESGFVPSQMLLANLDDDGLLDLVLTDDDHAVATLHGVLPESFALARELDLAVSPSITRAGDLDGDGRDDLLVLGRTDGAVQVLLSQPNGTMLPLAPVVTSGIEPYDATLGDLDGDGDLDAAVVDEDTARLYLLRGDGTGALDDITRRALPSGAIRVHATDLEGDGIDDVVAATFADGSLSLLLSSQP